MNQQARTRTRFNRAISQGGEAFAAGKGPEANPYDAAIVGERRGDHALAQAWVMGFNAARGARAAENVT